MNKIKNVKKSADASLEKVRSKKWSKPLGKTLNVTGKIVTGIGTAVPGKVITHKLCGEPVGSTENFGLGLKVCYFLWVFFSVFIWKKIVQFKGEKTHDFFLFKIYIPVLHTVAL